jgi:hypothetical protein
VRHAALIAFAILPALAAGSDSSSWKVEDHETIQRTFQMAAGANPKRLTVDNLDGFIHVNAYSGSEIRVSVERSTTADSREALAEARHDVKLEMSQQGNSVRLYADTPSRHNNCCGCCRNYRVRFDYEIQVPKEVELELKNLNREIQVTGTAGDFDIHGLNGRIDMESVAGSGSVHTLNGKVRVVFARNPQRASEFHTLNGEIDVYFQQPLNANLNFKTLNGGVWADFDVAPTVDSSVREQHGVKLIYSSARTNRTHSGRAGGGGPLLSFSGLNGPIRLHTKPQ